MAVTESFAVSVPPDAAGERLDAFLAAQLRGRGCSRAALQRAIREGRVLLDGARCEQPNRKLRAAQRIEAELPDPHVDPEMVPVAPEAIDVPLLHADAEIVVVNKPAGMPVHPGPGHGTGTLANALRALAGDALSCVNGPGRPGIVHRLDRDTTGVMVVARTDRVHHELGRQFTERTTSKEYLAIVEGVPDRLRGEIDLAIQRHPTQRKKMAVVRPERRVYHGERPGERWALPPPAKARAAFTRWEVVEKLGRFALLRAFPRTGRTHQIRVHLAAIGHPVLCDAMYGRRERLSERDLGGADDRVLLARQALHAARLAFDHPRTGERVAFEAPLPEDMQSTLAALRAAAQPEQEAAGGGRGE